MASADNKNSKEGKRISALKMVFPYIIPYKLQLGYENCTVDECLRLLLPSKVLECNKNTNNGLPGSFETIGHIAHVNLQEPFIQYKHLIGKVILGIYPLPNALHLPFTLTIP